MATKGTPATLLLARQHVRHTLHTYQHDPRVTGYGDEAAAAAGVDPTRVFKTLVASVEGTLAVGVVPVSGSLDLKALAGVFGGKRAAMATPADAERATGYVRGGISPLGHRRTLPIAIDQSIRDHETIFVSGGRRGLSIELAPADLVRLTTATVALIATGSASRPSTRSGRDPRGTGLVPGSRKVSTR